MKLDSKDILLIIFIAALGLFIRISAPLSAIFPLNDGGLFYKMILDLQENHFVLPMFTSYNNSSLPFAYPPLAFYFFATVSEIFHISILNLMQFLPSIISALTIPAFLLLSREILDTKEQAIYSALVFTFIPRAFEWLIMGGGVTRSLGFLFAILAKRQYIILISSPSPRNLILSALFSGLVILTHPEASVHLIISLVLIYFWKSRTVAGLKNFISAGLGALILSAPWWLVVVMRHGLDPFFAALISSNQDSYNLVARVLVLFRFNFTDEPYLTLISSLGLIGMFVMIARGKSAIPIWFCLIQLIEPRGGALYMMLPLSLAAGFALQQIILPALTKDMLVDTFTSFKFNVANSFIGFIFLYGILSASSISNKIVQQLTLTENDLDALAWVQENTPVQSRFIVVTGGDPLNDSTSEWFPALTNRSSIATIFGRERINDGGFGTSISSYNNLQNCFTRDDACIDQWALDNNVEFNYVYIKKMGQSQNPNALLESLRNSANYIFVYETNEVGVLQRINLR